MGDDVVAGFAVAVVGVGVLLAGAHLLVWAVAARRGRRRPAELIGFGYVGVGLALSLVAFYLARGLADGDWGGVADAEGLVLLLGAASWGYGSAYEWAQVWDLRRPRWVAPLVVSLLAGAAVGASATTLQV